MQSFRKFFIGGAWVDPVEPSVIEVINPATEEVFAEISAGAAADVDRAAAAARKAFETFGQTTRQERLALLRRVLDAYNARYEDIARALTAEMGAPAAFAKSSQAYVGRAHLEATIEALENFVFEESRGTTRVVKEPIGVVGLITPWNWPMNQIVCKVAPALAAGCTMILKPSEIAPISGVLFAEVMEAAGVPAGVFNLINGTGPAVGQVMASHPGIDMISFTGSTRAGIIVAKAAADTVKRVSQELGGKSANIILADADFEDAVRQGVKGCMSNSGQSCDAPTRMFVPADRMDEALAIAQKTAETLTVGDPEDDGTDLGPVVSKAQFDKIQGLIKAGIDEGAALVTGGLGLPDNVNRGYYVKPTIFGNVRPEMRISREEIFGPVLSILAYTDEEDAIRKANDTVYGLAAYVQSGDINRARKVAGRLRAGLVSINYPDWDTHAPFGGYKQSGNGREYADFGIHDYVEIKGIAGYGAT